MRLVISALVFLAALYVVLLIAAWRMQERIVWQPPRLAQYPTADPQRLDYRSDDGQPLFAFLVGNAARAPGLLIAYHGNADLAAWVVPWASEVERATGWAVLVPEYRGYGGLGGSPDYLSSQRDARATYRLAREHLGKDSARIALYGHSLGSAIATELAVEHAPAVLILEAPFTSAREMARGPLAPVALLWDVIARVHFDTRSRVAELDVPTWVVHGERDGVIPVRMGRAVYAAARIRGELLLVRGAGHNDVSDVAGEAYWSWLRRALDSAASASR
ncbi:MAG TPA: alpha/beta fold hydrolase [Gemmatimonadaceae bacterium]|nr:alpha/beta fold hydrolase [Gemmatimonadaceae bacterium]